MRGRLLDTVSLEVHMATPLERAIARFRLSGRPLRAPASKRRRADDGGDSRTRVWAAEFRAATEQRLRSLERAREIEGLDDEIALMQVRLKRAVEERPADAQLLVKGLGTLVRAVGARYRLSPKSRKELAENLAATLISLGDQLLPPEG